MIAQAAVEHVGIVACKCSIAISVAGHHIGALCLAVFATHGRHGTQCQRAVSMLDNLVAYHGSRPVWLFACATTHTNVLLVDIAA